MHIHVTHIKLFLLFTGDTELECQEKEDLLEESANDRSDLVTVTPISHRKNSRENRERKKIRDRLQTASLVMVFLSPPSFPQASVCLASFQELYSSIH